MKYAAVGLAGAVGALTRYLFAAWSQVALPTGFPLGTMLINASGTFVLGFITAYGIERGHLPEPWRLPVTVGFLGSYTTFSTWTVETVVLLDAGRWAWASLNVARSLGLGLLAVWLGQRLGHRTPGPATQE